MSVQRSSVPLPAPLSIEFLVVGGGICGLASAIALRRVGHQVTVLEKEDGEKNRGECGIRLPPNMSKILFHWGLKDKLKQIALTSQPSLFAKYDSGELLGSQIWEGELLAETCGEFMFTTHSELHKILTDAALAAGAIIRTNAEVVEIAEDECAVTLATGEVLSADVLIGADGPYGLCRADILGRQDPGQPMGVAMYDMLVATKDVTENFVKLTVKDTAQFLALGNGRAVVALAVHNGDDIAVQWYFREETAEGAYGDPRDIDPSQLDLDCNPDLRSVLEHATPAARIPFKQFEELEDWVHDDKPLIVLGEAAHPFTPGSLQGPAMAVEDAAVLGKLFSHLNTKDQIESFLYAFQDLRQARTKSTLRGDIENVFTVMLEDGPMQEMRDNMMRQKRDEGANLLDQGEGEESKLWEEIRTIFGYDCEDEADNWWVEWGLLRERAREMNDPGSSLGVSFANMSIQVNEAIADAS
ncbi:FAD/NAD-P-binding domain-containing protein [Obba rivulosa]|uniref:FAD/NAD-P-binding domain-containing protein n=1 Tax=Obba rivulosa TaxID=1052685 RepID=A0A8E2AWY4_9APHY|nr:FAD/NAD-P-binding domain-containing protein [Obba rivulosa]